MAIMGMKRGMAAFLGILFLTTGAGAQGTFVLPWLETPPSAKPKVNLADIVKAPTPAQPPAQMPAPQGAPLQQVQGTKKSDSLDGDMSTLIQLTPPVPERLFRFESEETLRARIRAEYKDTRKVEFPATHEVMPALELAPRIWPYLVATAEPSYVCYQRLWFEQKNSERYGWDLGVLQPLVSAGVFYTDLALLPLHWVTDPCRWYDCSSGECLPGDAVPFLWNPLLAK